MSFETFLRKISNRFPSTIKLEAMASLDPEKIYIENVRSILGVSSSEAERICETAARQGVFERRVEVLCPDGVIAFSATSEVGLPSVVTCWSNEDGELQEREIPVAILRKVTYYKLHEQQPIANSSQGGSSQAP
jgi:hypothetical protein